MKKKTFITGFIFVVLSISASAQYWNVLGGGVNWIARSVYPDTIDNLIYVVGQFRYAGGQDSTIVNAIGVWNGNTWSSFENGLGDSTCSVGACGIVGAVQRYNNDIFVSGYFSFLNEAPPIKNLARWDGNNWQHCGEPNIGGALDIINDDLFLLGGFDTIGGNYIHKLAKWNGSGWEPFESGLPFVMPDGFSLGSGEYYKDSYYFGGNFNVGNGFNDIMGWDGAQWFPLENGIPGSMGWVNDMLVYRDYLFVGGYFWESDGNVADHLMTWDGEKWADPFPDVYFTSQVKDFAIINDELYIAGAFFMAGDTSWYGLAKYDGVNFCAIGGAFNFVNTIAELNDTLYAATETAFAGDTLKFVYYMPVNVPVDNCIYAGLGNTEIGNNHIQVYPNPVISDVIINLSGGLLKGELSIYDNYGRLIKKQVVQQDIGQLNLDISALAPGCYYIRLISDSGESGVRFIKQ